MGERDGFLVVALGLVSHALPIQVPWDLRLRYHDLSLSLTRSYPGVVDLGVAGSPPLG